MLDFNYLAKSDMQWSLNMCSYIVWILITKIVALLCFFILLIFGNWEKRVGFELQGFSVTDVSFQ